MANGPIAWAESGAIPLSVPLPRTLEYSMADYPCDAHRSRYPGPSHRVYLNIYREDDKAQLKGSVCGDCLANLVSDWLSWALRQSPDGWTVPADGDDTTEVPWMPSGGPIDRLPTSRRW